jgi:hypothetical protein
LRDLLKKGEGGKCARAKQTMIADHPTSEDLFALVQIDPTLAEIIVVAKGSCLPIGRPWLKALDGETVRKLAGSKFLAEDLAKMLPNGRDCRLR